MISFITQSISMDPKDSAALRLKCIYVAKNKGADLLHCNQLHDYRAVICTFVFANAKGRFSHDVAHKYPGWLKVDLRLIANEEDVGYRKVVSVMRSSSRDILSFWFLSR